jgi:hypothetical protein
LKGWTEEIKLIDMTEVCIRESLPVLVEDSASIEELLQKYAIAQVAMGSPSNQLVQRLNKTLNIQWTIDIRSKFPKEESNRNLENVEDWIHAIEDEDDRDQVLLWAKQVAKGKITEADFGEKIKAFI